jgi:hypothetical protein
MRLLALRLALPVLLASPAATGCSSNYHPEYHPVTVTSYEQHVAVAPGQAGPPQGVTMNAPAPPPPPQPAPWSAWPDE